MNHCDQGCCEIMPAYQEDGEPYSICADCGNDEGHVHGQACSFCGSTGLSAEVIAARKEDDEKISAMQEHAVQHIEADQQDPRSQRYFMRLDRHSIIKTEAEFKKCQQQGVRMAVVNWKQAVASIKAEKSQSDKQKKIRTKAKATRQARKKNRSR